MPTFDSTSNWTWHGSPRYAENKHPLIVSWWGLIFFSVCLWFNIEFGSLQKSPFDNTSIEKIFDRFKDRFFKVFAEELKTINLLEYVDDEFPDIYRWIGVDIPVEGDDEDRSSNSHGEQKAVEDAVVRFGFSQWSVCSRVDDIYGFLVMLRMLNKSRTKLHPNLKYVKGGQYLTPLNVYLFFHVPFKYLESPL